MRKFLAHDMIDIDGIISHIIEDGIFRGYVHPPPGFPGLQFLDISLRIRVFGQAFNIFADNPPVLLGPFPDESPGIVFDFYPHALPRLQAKLFFGLIPRDIMSVFVNFVKIPLKGT